MRHAKGLCHTSLTLTMSDHYVQGKYMGLWLGQERYKVHLLGSEHIDFAATSHVPQYDVVSGPWTNAKGRKAGQEEDTKGKSQEENLVQQTICQCR